MAIPATARQHSGRGTRIEVAPETEAIAAAARQATKPEGNLRQRRMARQNFSRRLPLAWRSIGAFTLIEVLMAIALFTVATGILAGSLYTGLQAYRSAAVDAKAENRYRMVLRQVMLISGLQEFEQGGTLRLPDGGRAEWQAQVNEDSVLLDLFEASVTVRLRGDSVSSANRADAEQERVFNLQLYRPDWSDAGKRGQLLEDRQRALEQRRLGR